MPPRSAARLALVVRVCRAAGATPVLLNAPYFADGTPYLEVRRWNALLSGVARATGTRVRSLHALLDPGNRYSSVVDGVAARTTDGIHLTFAGVTEVVDPWLLGPLVAIGLAARRSPRSRAEGAPPSDAQGTRQAPSMSKTRLKRPRASHDATHSARSTSSSSL